MKNANICKDFYSELARNLLRKLSVGPKKFHSNSRKQYYMNIEVNYHNLELCNAALEIIKKILSCLYTSKALNLDGISSKFLKDGVDVSGLTLYNIVNLPIK